MSTHIRKIAVGARVQNRISPRHGGAQGVVVALVGSRVRVRWEDGTERVRHGATLRRVDDELARLETLAVQFTGNSEFVADELRKLAAVERDAQAARARFTGDDW